MEKFLELNSEQNHDDYCLAYVFTDRDFDDGVLGLAWVGAPSGIFPYQDTFPTTVGFYHQQGVISGPIILWDSTFKC